ncbi:hypothetical protein [Arthrobacter sp. Rue61a]|uniref:hypothetical protein n=1 Tax=Arthrobacter sp. Rue61a TaxID=1118963 RepID=UPI0013924075|nr:hypothetical protein [Arthrobacter sp. Rue61a]
MSGSDAVEGLAHQLSFELVEGQSVGAFAWPCEEGRDEVAAVVSESADTAAV